MPHRDSRNVRIKHGDLVFAQYRGNNLIGKVDALYDNNGQIRAHEWFGDNDWGEYVQLLPSSCTVVSLPDPPPEVEDPNGRALYEGDRVSYFTEDGVSTERIESVYESSGEVQLSNGVRRGCKLVIKI